MKSVVLLSISWFLLVANTLFSQLSYKINLESGVFFNSLESNFSENTNVYRLQGNLRYKTKFQNSTSSFSLKIKPEIFGDDYHSIKYAAQGDYQYNATNVLWKSLISYRNFNYIFSESSTNFSSFNFIVGSEFDLLNNHPIQLYLGYAYQNIDFAGKRTSDYFYLDSKLKNSVTNQLSYQYGFFIENFISENNTIKENGWYYGPQVSLSYLKQFLLNLEYKILLISSTNLTFPSLEHRIKTIGGIRLNQKLSFFLLADLYIRDTHIKNSKSEKKVLLPTKNENHISTKINYKFLNNLSIYLKAGYFREELLSDNSKIDGLNVIVGIELKN